MVIDCVEGSEIHRPGPACRLLPEPLLHFPCGSFGKGNHKNGRRIHITFFYQMKNTLDNCISFPEPGPASTSRAPFSCFMAVIWPKLTEFLPESGIFKLLNAHTDTGKRLFLSKDFHDFRCARRRHLLSGTAVRTGHIT